MEIDANFDLALLRANPAYFAARSRYVFPTTCGKRTYKFAKINEQTKYAVERAENREMGLRRGSGGWEWSIVHVIFARRFGSRPNVIIKSDRHARTFAQKWATSRTNERAHPRQWSCRRLGRHNREKEREEVERYRSAVRDKNRRYEEYQWRPVECSCQYLNDTVMQPLVDSVLVRIQCGSRCEITFRIALSFGRMISS